MSLESDPAPCIGIEKSDQPKRRVNGDASLTLDDLVDTPRHNANRLGPRRPAEPHRFQPVLQQDDAGMHEVGFAADERLPQW